MRVKNAAAGQARLGLLPASPYLGTPCFHLSQWTTTFLMKGAEAAHRLFTAGTKPPESPSGPHPHSECQAISPGYGRSKLDAVRSTATRLRSTSPDMAARE